MKKGVQLVGIDYLSLAPYKQSQPTHRVLLDAGVVVIEGLDLREVTRGRYTLHCLPLKIMGSDGARDPSGSLRNLAEHNILSFEYLNLLLSTNGKPAITRVA